MIVGAQIEIERAMAELSRNGLSTADLVSQLSMLTQLQRAVAAASPIGLANLRTEAIGAAATAQYIAQQSVLAAAGKADTMDAADRLAVARATVDRVHADLFERRVFDPYLTFASPEDEREYRERERQRKEAIELEKAKGTPQGYANAVALEKAQIADAKDHGADASPEFKPMSDALDAAASALPKPDKAVTIGGKPLAGSRDDLPAPANEMDDAMAALRAAGVKPKAIALADPDHGVTDDKRIMSAGAGKTV